MRGIHECKGARDEGPVAAVLSCSMRTRVVVVEVPNFWRNKRITSLAIRVTVIQY